VADMTTLDGSVALTTLGLVSEMILQGRTVDLPEMLTNAEKSITPDQFEQIVAISLCHALLTPAASKHKLLLMSDKLEAFSRTHPVPNFSECTLAVAYQLGKQELLAGKPHLSTMCLERSLQTAHHMVRPMSPCQTSLGRLESLWRHSPRCEHILLVARAYAVALVQCGRYSEALDTFGIYHKCLRDFSDDRTEKNDLVILEALVHILRGDINEAKELLLGCWPPEGNCLESTLLLAHLCLADGSFLSNFQLFQDSVPTITRTFSSPSVSASFMNLVGVLNMTSRKMSAAQV
jgi:hypothetical protein